MVINGISDGVYTVRKLYPVYLRQGRTGNSPASRVQSPCGRSRVPQNAGIEQVNSSQLWMPFHGNLSCGHGKKLKTICRYTILPRVKIKVVPCLATSFAVVQVRKMAKKRGGGEVAAVQI